MSRLVIALVFSICAHAFTFGLLEQIVVSPSNGGDSRPKDSGLRVSLGVLSSSPKALELLASEGQTVSQDQRSNILPELLPEIFIPTAPSYDALQSYLPAGDVDRRPTPESSIVVPFPKDGVLHAEKGEVVLELYVGADGRVEYVKVESSNVSPPFQKVALDTFWSAKMTPGIKGGKAVRVKLRIVVEFEENSVN